MKKAYPAESEGGGNGQIPVRVDSVLINTPVMEWGVRFYVLSKQEWKQQTIDRCGQFYCLVPSNAGFHVYLFVTMDTGENAVFVFPPHFFIRYRERYWENTVRCPERF